LRPPLDLWDVLFKGRFAVWFLLGVVLVSISAAPAAAEVDGPIVILESPADASGFYQGQQAQAAYGCLPGPMEWPVVECVGEVPIGAPLDTSSVGEHIFTVRAIDYVGAETTVTHTYTVFDVIPPTASIRSPADGAVYPYGAEVVADYSCDDGPGGSPIAGCIATLPSGAPIEIDQLGTFTFRVDAYDTAMNHGSATASYRVVDLTPPTITVTSPTDGAQFRLGEAVTPRYRCYDQIEGARVSCEATPIDTSTYGVHTFRVDTRDSSGNAASVVRTYSVVYDFDGFFSPLAPALGSLSYKAAVDRYVFLWKTDPTWAGSCRELVVALADGTSRRANVRFR
jgi:hypothetical protein